jgi:hypothetical protein
LKHNHSRIQAQLAAAQRSTLHSVFTHTATAQSIHAHNHSTVYSRTQSQERSVRPTDAGRSTHRRHSTQPWHSNGMATKHTATAQHTQRTTVKHTATAQHPHGKERTSRRTCFPLGCSLLLGLRRVLLPLLAVWLAPLPTVLPHGFDFELRRELENDPSRQHGQHDPLTFWSMFSVQFLSRAQRRGHVARVRLGGRLGGARGG